MGSVCVTGSGFGAAQFCDIVGRFYMPGPVRNANQVLPVGLPANGPMPPDPPMVKTAIAGAYPRSVLKVSDTSLPEAVIRNGVIFNAEAVIIVSAEATFLSKSLDLLGVPELFRERVKRLVIVDAGAKQDVAAMRKVLAEWPGPVFYCGKEVGEALPFPGERVAKDFAWAPAHPVVDAYRAYRDGVYDAPSYDVAAAHFAVHPDSGFFTTEDGALTVGDDGAMQFRAGAGKVKALRVDASKKDAIVEAFVAAASAKPVAPQQRRPASNAGEKE